MILSLIAAIGKNNELGKKNALLWNLPIDMKHFRDTTRGHTVIMGQKTYASLGKPLPNRRNIVVTRNKDFQAEEVDISHSLEETLESCKNTDEEIFVIGGGEIYKQTIGKADRLYLTHVEATFPDADAFFPKFDTNDWNVVSEESHPKDDKHAFSFTFKTYVRK